MGRRTKIMQSLIADLKAIGVFAEVRRQATLPAATNYTQFPFASLWLQNEDWSEMQFPSRVMVDASIILDIFDRKASRDEAFDNADDLIEQVSDAIYDNSARVLDGVIYATQTRIDRIDFGEVEETGLSLTRLTLIVRQHRAPGSEA